MEPGATCRLLTSSVKSGAVSSASRFRYFLPNKQNSIQRIDYGSSTPTERVELRLIASVIRSSSPH